MNWNWKDAGEAERELFRDEMNDALSERLARGHEEYGDEFQGRPLMHLQDELLDALFYTWYAGRQMTDAFNQLDAAEKVSVSVFADAERYRKERDSLLEQNLRLVGELEECRRAEVVDADGHTLADRVRELEEDNVRVKTSLAQAHRDIAGMSDDYRKMRHAERGGG